MVLLVYVVLAISTFIGGVVSGISGFGVGIIIQAIWNVINNNIDLHLNELDTELTYLQVSLGVVACVFPFNTSRIAYDMYTTNSFHMIQYNIVIATLITLLPCSTLGTYLIVHINNNILKKILGCTFFIFAVYQITIALRKSYHTLHSSNQSIHPTDLSTDQQSNPVYIAVPTSDKQPLPDNTIPHTPQRNTFIQSVTYWMFNRNTYYALFFGSLAGVLSGSFGTGGMCNVIDRIHIYYTHQRSCMQCTNYIRPSIDDSIFCIRFIW